MKKILLCPIIILIMIACTHSGEDMPNLGTDVSKDELVLKIIDNFRSDLYPTPSRY